MVAVCGADNALIESPTLTAEHLSSLHWIVSYDATTQYTPADKHLRFAGVERQVEVVVQNFLGLPFLLACTNRVAILQQRLAEKLRVAGGIRVLELPLSVPELIEAANHTQPFTVSVSARTKARVSSGSSRYIAATLATTETSPAPASRAVRAPGPADGCRQPI